MNTINVMRQAIEALEYHTAQTRPVLGTEAAITALRAELERLETVEPVACQACGGPATHNAEEDRTGLPGPYCNDCDPPTAAPIAPSIPALTAEDVRTELTRQYDEDGGAHFLKLADWAYALAAERAGARIIKADTMQELADDAKQIGLEY